MFQQWAMDMLQDCPLDRNDFIKIVARFALVLMIDFLVALSKEKNPALKLEKKKLQLY
ncbi:hypothetical protein PARA125_001364 [Parachlamydia sp. AcF125]|nr:hypothetical protein [Parachlamydia sp. AcF125]